MSLSKEEALKKLQHYCAYQDRCHSEVSRKLSTLGIWGDWAEEIKAELIRENFLNEERFARSFARGKFRIKNWGKIRIVRELKKREISDYCIKKGLSEIDEAEYWQTLNTLLKKKRKALEGAHAQSMYKKLTQYALNKGYEWPLIKAAIAGMRGPDSSDPEGGAGLPGQER